MATIALIVLLCGWTGYGIFRLAGPREIRMDVPGVLFACVLMGILLNGWIALVAAEFGFFSIWALVITGVLMGFAGWLVGRHKGKRIGWEGLWWGEYFWMGLLLLLMGLLYFRPHEFIFGGADAGVYVNLGANIAQSGRWLIHHPDLAAIPPETYPMFFREHPSYMIPRYNYLPGFYVSDGGAQTIIPQFYPLHPVWLAIAHSIGGVWASLYMTPLWGMLGVLAFYFAIREAFEPRLAAVAATVLALTPTQVWFARYPTSEVLTQFLLFGGLWAFARFVRRSETWAAVVSGVALGQVMLARADTYFLLGVLPAYAAYLYLQRRLDRRFWLFAGPVLAIALHSFLHAVFQGWPYFYNIYFTSRFFTGFRIAMLAAGLLIAGLGFLIASRIVHCSGGMRRLEAIWKIGLTVAAALLVLLAAYAYFLRPLQADPLRASPYWYGGNTIPDVEPYNMVRLGWYLSRPGLALGVLGIALIVSRSINERTWMMVGLGVFFSVLFIYRTFNNPHHVYVMRRYVPAVIPTFALGMAWAALYLVRWGNIGRVLATSLVVAIVLLMPYKGQVMIPQVDYKGAVEQFRSLADLIPRNAIILFNDDEPVGAAGIFGTPLAFLEGYTALDLREEHLDLKYLDTLVVDWQRAGRPVVVIEGMSPVSGLCDRWKCQLLGYARFDLRVLEHSYDHWPVIIVPYQPVLTLYTIEQIH